MISLKRAVAAGACALCLATPAWAQRENGPFSGLFNGADTRGRAESFDFRSSLSGSYADTLNDDELASDPNASEGLYESGGAATVNAGLSYGKQHDAFSLSLQGNGALQRYSTQPDVTPYSGSGLFNLGFQASRRITMTTGVQVSYSPFYQASPFGGPPGGGGVIAEPPGFGFSTQAEPTVSWSANYGIGASIGRRGNLTADLSAYGTRFPDQPDSTMSSWGGRARYTHMLSKGLGFHFGWGRERVGYGTSPQSRSPNDTYDFGIDYNYDKELRLTRKTTLGFTTGSSLVSFDGDTHFSLNGTVRLTRSIKRSWSTAVGYYRLTSYTTTFQAPVVSDNVDGSLSGLISRRVQFTAGAAYSRGIIGFNGDQTYSTYTASTSLSYALTRTLGLSTQYGIYNYAIPAGSSAVLTVPRMTRQSVSVSLNFWKPLLNPRSSR